MPSHSHLHSSCDFSLWPGLSLSHAQESFWYFLPWQFFFHEVQPQVYFYTAFFFFGSWLFLEFDPWQRIVWTCKNSGIAVSMARSCPAHQEWALAKWFLIIHHIHWWCRKIRAHLEASQPRLGGVMLSSAKIFSRHDFAENNRNSTLVAALHMGLYQGEGQCFLCSCILSIQNRQLAAALVLTSANYMLHCKHTWTRRCRIPYDFGSKIVFNKWEICASSYFQLTKA